MDRIQVKASELWDLLFADQTAETYQKALNLTGTIIKEFAQLIWLIICSVFVFGAWFSDTSVRAGKSIREWVAQSSSEDSLPTNSQSVAEKGKSLLDQVRTGIVYLLNQAREQLGIDPEEMPAIERTANAIKPDSISTPATSVSETSAPATSTPAPSASETSAPATSAPATSAPETSAPATSASVANPPTVDPFARPASSQTSDETSEKPSGGPSSQTVGSSRGAGSQNFGNAPEDIVREDYEEDWSDDHQEDN